MAHKNRIFNYMIPRATKVKEGTISSSSTFRRESASSETTHSVFPLQKKQDISDQYDPSPSKHKMGQKSFESIPGPKGLPLVGTLFDYMTKDGLQFNKIFEVFRQRSVQYGPIFKEKIASMTSVVITDPAEYTKVIRSEGKYPRRIELTPWFVYREKKKMGQGLVNSQGPEWRRFRSAASKKLLKIKEVSEFCTDMDKVADDLITQISRLRNPQGEVAGIEMECFKFVMESVGTLLFGSKLNVLGPTATKEARDLIENIHGIFRMMQVLSYSFPIYKIYPTKDWQQFENHCDNVFRIAGSYINKKVVQIRANPAKEGERASFIEYMMNHESLTEQEALSTCIDLFVASMESTSNGILWALYCLAINLETQEKLFKEIEDVLPDNQRITPDTLSKLKYVKAVVKETFRLYPLTFATSRILENDIEVRGYNIPAGTHVQANLYTMMRDSQYFQEPEVFKPERWLKESSMKIDLNYLSNLVWGHGARMCIGRRIAEQEMHIILTKIVRKYKVVYNHGFVEPVLHFDLNPDRPPPPSPLFRESNHFRNKWFSIICR